MNALSATPRKSRPCSAKFQAGPIHAIMNPATAGPIVRITLKAMVLRANALATSARGTTSNNSVLRSVRSKVMPAPESSVNANRCQTSTRSNASPSASSTEIANIMIWLAASARLRSKRSATSPDTGESNSIGIARTPSTAPSSAPEPVKW